MGSRQKIVYICGNSQTPETAAIGSQYKRFALELLIDVESYIIKDASCTLITDLGRKFVSTLFVGRHIFNEKDQIVDDIQIYYQAVPQKALISAFLQAYNRFKQFLDKIEKEGAL